MRDIRLCVVCGEVNTDDNHRDEEGYVARCMSLEIERMPTVRLNDLGYIPGFGHG